MTTDLTGQGDLRDHVIPGDPFPGAVVIAYVRAMNLQKENPALDTDKARPAVLSRQKPNGWWLAWGLTTLDKYGDGNHRAVANGLDRCGLASGYVFGGHVVQLPPEDILGVVWAAPHELLLACVEREQGLSQTLGVRIAYQLHSDMVSAGWTWPK